MDSYMLSVKKLPKVDAFFFNHASKTVTDIMLTLPNVVELLTDFEPNGELLLLNNNNSLILYGLCVLYKLAQETDDLRVITEFNPAIIRFSHGEIVRQNKVLQTKIEFVHKYKPLKLILSHTFFTDKVELKIEAGDIRLTKVDLEEFKTTLKDAIYELRKEIAERIKSRRLYIAAASLAEVMSAYYLLNLTNSENFPI